jgi:hypothetical protein
MMRRKRLDDDSLWLPLILPHMYTNGTGSGGHGRNARIEIREPTFKWQRDLLLEVEIDCVTCGHPIRPIRERADGSLYLAVSCEQAARPGCSRSATCTSVEVERLIDLIRGYDDPRQPSLFGDWARADG